MLKRVKVKNVALIDESEVQFGDHLNILTGETGAGKSILIDAIHLALGAKADKTMIRQGAEYAFVELEFLVKKEETRQKLRELEVYPEEDGTVLLQRRIMPGKSSMKINGESVTLKTLKDAAYLLIDIHGQHEHQSLLNERRHMQFLDAYCGNELKEPKEQMAAAYDVYKELEKEWNAAQETDENKERDLSLAQFELKEINEAELTIGEDETLEQEFNKMDHVRLIGQSVGTAVGCLENYDDTHAIGLLSMASKSLQQAIHYDESLQQAMDGLAQAEESLRESLRFMTRYMDGLEVDESRYVFVTERLNVINHLKKKYGNTIEEILEYGKKQQVFLDKFENFEQYKQELSEKLAKAKNKLIETCKVVSEIRKKNAILLSESLRDALLELNFPHVAFETAVSSQEDNLSKEGYDTVRFMISLNAGEGLKPLTSVASGGELSRIMLALKAVMASQEEIESLIFDEIDAGISGKTAWKVSEKLAVLGNAHQVICITHLPQIAAMADQHFVIEKTQTQESTKTKLTVLNQEGEILEIARLLGSDTVTEAVYTNAKELKELATKTKGY